MVFTGRLARKLETFDNKFLGFHDSGVLTELHSIAAELNTNEFPKPSTTSYPLRRGRKKTSTTTTQKADNSTKACSDRPQSLLRAPSCMLDATSRKTQCSTTDSTAKKDTDPIQKSLIAIESIMGEGDSKDDETCAIESNVPENTIGSTPPVQFDVTQLTLQSDAEQQPTLSDSDPMEHGVTVPVDGCIPNAMAVSNAMALAPDSIKLKQHGFPTKNQMKGMETKKWSSKDNNDPATATTGIQDAPFKVGTRVFRWSMNRDKEDTNFQSLHDSGVFTELQDIVAGIDKNDFPMPSARRGKKTKQAISPRSTLPSSPSSQEGALMADVPSEGNLGEQKGEEATSTSVEPDEASFVRTSVLRQPSMDLDDLIEASRLYKEQTRAQVQDHAGEEFCPPAENPGTSEIKTRPRNSSPESAVAVKKLSSRVKTNYQSFHDSGVLTELQDIAARLDKHEFIKPSLRRRKKKPSAFSSPTKQNQLEPDARLSSDGIIESPVGTNELVEPYTPKMESKPTERSVRKKSHKQSKSQQQIGADNEPRVHPDVERNLSKEKISPVDFKKASAQGKAPDSKNGVSRRTRKTIEPESNFKSLHDSGVFLELHLIVDEIGKEEFPKPSQSRRRGMKKAPLPSTSKTCQKEPKEKSQKAGTSCESDSKIVEVHSTTSRLTGVESKLKRTEKMDAGMSRHSVNDGSKKRSANRKLDNVISRLTAKPESRSTNHQLLQKQLETVTESMSLGLKKATVGIDQSDRVAKSPKDLEQCAGVEKVASSGVSHSPTRGESSNDSGTRTRYRRASISGGPAGSSRGRSSNGRQTSTRRGSISGDPPATSPDRNFQPATSPDRNFQPSPSSQRKRSAVLNFLERVSPANRRRSLSSSHAERSSRTDAEIKTQLTMKNLDSYSSHADSVYVQKRLLKSKLHKKSTPQRDVNDGALPASVEEVQLHVGTVEKSPNLSDTVGDEGIEYEMDSHPTGVSLKKMQSAAQQRRFSLTQHSSPVKRRMIKKVHSLKELALESMSLPDENPVAKRDYQSPTNSTSSTVPQSPRMSSNLKSSSHKDHFSLFLHDSSSKCDETASKKVAKFENDKKLSQSCHGTSSSSKKNRRSDVERISATKSPMKTKNRTTAEARQLSMSQHRPQRKPLNVEKSPFKEKTQKSKSSTSSSAKQKAESMEDMQKLVAKLERQLACYKNEKRASSPSKIHSMNYSSSPTNTSIAPTTPRSPSKMGVLKKNYTATSAKVWSSLKLPWTLKSEPTSDIKETTGSLVET